MKKFSAVMAVVALATLTCTSDRGIINGFDEPPIGSTPEKVLQRLEYSFNHLDVYLLKPCLSENFVFYIDPNEAGRNPGGGYKAPSSYTDFWRTAEYMFERAYMISMSIDSGGVGAPDPEENTYGAGCRVCLLVMVTEYGGFLAEGDAGFECEKYVNEADEDRWRIRKWWDHTAPERREGDPAEPTAGIKWASVAAILAYYQ